MAPSETNETPPLSEPAFTGRAGASLSRKNPWQMTSERLREVYSSRLQPLLALEAGWDGLSAQPISHPAAAFLTHILMRLFRECRNLGVPDLTPLPSGGIQAEWHTVRGDFEIEIKEGWRFRWLFKDHILCTEGSGEGPFRDLIPLLAVADNL